MANLFEAVADRVRNSMIVIWVFILSALMLAIGLNHFAEDTYSSFMGIQWLQQTYGLIPASWQLTYWTMSIAPQVAQVVFAYMFIVDTDRNRWAFWAAFLAFLMDFGTDIWYRSNQGLFDSTGKFVVTSALTFVYFTIGSEGFVTIGFGMVMELFAPFIVQTRLLVKIIFDAFTEQIGHRSQSRPMPQKPKPDFRSLGGKNDKNATFQEFFNRHEQDD